MSPRDRDLTEQEISDVDPDEAERLLADESIRRRRRGLLDLIKETQPQDTRNYAVAPLLEERVVATFDAEGVTSDGGDPGIIGEVLVSLHRLLDALGADVIMRLLDFTSSVNIELEPVVPEPVRRRADELRRERPNDPLEYETLRELVPDSVAAANAAGRLLSSPPEEALGRARRFGADAAAAYLGVARAVAEHEGTLRLKAPGLAPTSLEADNADRVVARAREREVLEPDRFEIVGTLTRTDSEDNTFRVVLDRDLIPRQLDARRRVVDGEYSPNAARQVRERGLWDHRVLAKVQAWPVLDPLKSKPTYERFRFTSVRRAV